MNQQICRAVLLALAAAAPGVSLAQAATDATSGKPAAPASQSRVHARTSDTASAVPSQVEEIVVVANRYEATDLQLQSKSAVSVLSADDLSNTAVHNVAEALGLLPGVNVLNIATGAFIGGVDGASRAEGRYTSIRGMNGEYNVNLINGVEVAQASPYSRQVQLSLLPPSGLSTIVLNKVSRADMNGDAIGGTVDFRTPTAFDFDKPQASVIAGARYESRAHDYGKNNNGRGYNLAADMGRRFGADAQFGLYVSAYFDERNYANSEMGGVMESGCCDNGWSFATFNADGTSPEGVDPERNLQLNAMNVGVSSGYTKRKGGNISLDYRPSDDFDAYLRATYAKANTRQDSYLTQIVGMDVLKDAADGDNPFQVSPGVYRPDIRGVSIRYWYETNPEIADLGTVQLGFNKKLSSWTVSPNVFYSWGHNDRPDHIEISARTNSVQGGGITDNGFPYNQPTLFTYANRFPQAQLTPAMLAQLNDILSLPANDRGEVQEALSRQRKDGGRLDFQYEPGDGAFHVLKFGGKYVHSARRISFIDWTNPGHINTTASGFETFGDLPIWNGSYRPVFPGKYPWGSPRIDQSALFDYFESGFTPASLDTCGSIATNNLNCNTQKATENVSAAYVSAEFQFGNWEVTPGVRYEHTDVHNTYWVTPYDEDGSQLEGSWGKNKASFNELLPSLFVNFRPSAASVYRAGIWRSYTRPPFLQLGGGTKVERSNSGRTTITTGNPDLKSIRSTNFDLSAEWDMPTHTHIMVGAFYKRLQDFINDTGNTKVEQTSGSTGVVTVQPTNGGNGKVYGFEFAGRQLFKFLPSPFDGLGIGGTLTREYTSVDLNDPNFTDKKRMLNAPNWLANLELFYEKAGWELSFIYNYSGAYVAQYDALNQHASWDDLWVRPRRRLDMHAGYAFSTGVNVDLSVSNLLKDYTYWSHIGRNSLAVSDIVDSGLTGLLNVTWKF